MFHSLWEPQTSPLACKSQLPALTITSSHQYNIFTARLFHTTIYSPDSSNLLFNLFLTFQIMLPVICLYLFLDYNSNIVLKNCIWPSWRCEYWIQTKLLQGIFLEAIRLHTSKLYISALSSEIWFSMKKPARNSRQVIYFSKKYFPRFLFLVSLHNSC